MPLHPLKHGNNRHGTGRGLLHTHNIEPSATVTTEISLQQQQPVPLPCTLATVLKTTAGRFHAVQSGCRFQLAASVGLTCIIHQHEGTVLPHFQHPKLKLLHAVIALPI